MKSSNPPDLVLVVQSSGPNSRPWVLHPQGRNTFKIVVVCRPNKQGSDLIPERGSNPARTKLTEEAHLPSVPSPILIYQQAKETQEKIQEW